MHLRFGETESAFDYMMATREYLEQHGKPLAFYSDKHGIFRVNNGGSTTTGVTQFGRVLSELGIELICANSPQAKGRVERANTPKICTDPRLKATKSWMISLPGRSCVNCLKR